MGPRLKVWLSELKAAARESVPPFRYAGLVAVTLDHPNWADLLHYVHTERMVQKDTKANQGYRGCPFAGQSCYCNE